MRVSMRVRVRVRVRTRVREVRIRECLLPHNPVPYFRNNALLLLLTFAWKDEDEDDSNCILKSPLTNSPN